MSAEKVGKREFLTDVAKRCDMSYRDVESVYDAMCASIHDSVSAGDTVSLSGVGQFKLVQHKGHKVHFMSHDGTVDDYLVFRFFASDVLNKRFREELDCL